MTVELSWLDEEETILVFSFRSGYTWNDLATAMEKGQALMSEKPWRVDWIYSGDNNQTIPRGNPWAMLRAANQKIPANTGLLYVVNPGLFTRLMERIGQTAIPQSIRLMRTVDTLEEALQHIYESRIEENRAG